MVMLLHYGTCFNLRSTMEPLVRKAQVYAIDFGLAKKYRDSSTHQHIPYEYEDLLACIKFSTYLGRSVAMASEPASQGERWILATEVPFSSRNMST
ncbi:hypothetical protein ACSQ67_006815 [Phaseolus vulgaris]